MRRRGVRVGHQDRREPRRRELEDGSPGARDGQIRGREGVGERLDVLQQAVVRRRSEGVEPLAERRVVPRSARVQHRARRVPAERLERRVVDGAGPDRAPEDEQAGPRRQIEAAAGRLPVGGVGAGRDRAPGHLVAVAVAALEREGEEHPAREGREQPVGHAQVAVRLGQE